MATNASARGFQLTWYERDSCLASAMFFALGAGFVFLLNVAGCTRSSISDPELTASASAMDGHNELPVEASSGTLPACHWPASLNAMVPDGSIAGWNVFRSVLACGGSLADGGSGAELCGSDNGTACSNGGIGGVQYQPCVSACEPGQYAVLTANPSSLDTPEDPNPNVVEPSLSGDCGGTVSTFSIDRYAEGTPTVSCCPCQ